MHLLLMNSKPKKTKIWKLTSVENLSHYFTVNGNYPTPKYTAMNFQLQKNRENHIANFCLFKKDFHPNRFFATSRSIGFLVKSLNFKGL